MAIATNLELGVSSQESMAIASLPDHHEMRSKNTIWRSDGVVTLTIKYAIIVASTSVNGVIAYLRAREIIGIVTIDDVTEVYTC